ncbi:hypothetical protein Poli38472_013832 [Pythium oligandrum]|uniref:C2H2-type domain-containing protein n=1 Tax=Pythium oligandrum TaxID=41045 RepID=A0A8K1C269_PYTOL|nr:hypothetical protein Poli38472_013832 [Pythium oligandrum]|eukprot:TMW55070.1 hypothetical protein Poli38472_013832 [Pythium oligandrum]
MEESHEYGEEEFEDAGEEKEAETREAEAESYREEYEEEEETDTPAVEAPSPLQTMRFEDDDEEPSTASTPIRANKAVKKKKKTVKSVLDQSPWTYTVKAKRIRELRIPAANVWSGGADAPVKTPRGATLLPVIRDLRIFSVLDKQPMQSHGSKWKSEPRQDPPKPPNALSRSSISSATSPGRRSGVVQEAYWKNTHGELQWMFTMDRFRRLKAYSPRIKLFVYGIGVNAQADNVGALSEDSPRDHRKSIVSLGWFFLDLRTPDLPERWFKLQNSPFGGEIVVSTTFLPADMGHARQSHASQVVSNVEIPLKSLLKQQLFTSDATEEAVIDGNFSFGQPSTGGTVTARFSVELIKQVDEKHVEEEEKAVVASPDRPEMDSDLRDLAPLVVHVQHNKTEEALEEILVPNVTRKYRVFVQIKSLRNFESTNPVSISFVNPFSGKERIETPLLSLAKKAEVVVPDAHCIFDIYKDESSLRDTMEAPMILDVNETLSDGFRRLIGQAVFSVNYLYFSEETFCCADPNCGTVFKSDDDAHVHWRNTHRDSEASSSVAQIHSYKSCSIYLPVMSSDTPVNSSAPTRIGAVRLIASLEDMGILSSEEAAITQEMRVPRHMGRAPRRVHFQGGSTRVVESFDDDQSRNAIRPAVEVAMDDAVQDGSGNANVVSEPVDDSAAQREIQALKAQLLKERAAWQQEQVSQQTQWKKRLSDLEKARMDELEEEWARREEERSTVVRAAQTEYQQLEQKLRATLAEVDNRERNLAIAEAALERDQRMQREDHELLRKRLQSEQSHALQLAQRQVETLEKRVAELQSHLQIAEKRTQQIEEDFADYRRQQRKVPEAKLREEISSLKGHIVELERANLVETRAREEAEANVDKMREQLEKMAKLVQNEKKRNETRVLEELEKLRLKYVAREERYVLDGDREELRAIKKQLDELRQVNRVGRSRYDDTGSVYSVSRPHARVHIPQASPIHPRNHGDVLYEAEEIYEDTPATTELYDQDIIRAPTRKPRHPGPRLAARREMAVKENAQANDLPRDRELQRLQREKDLLLRTGTYDDNSFLVRELDRLIVLRQDQLTRQQRIL